MRAPDCNRKRSCRPPRESAQRLFQAFGIGGAPIDCYVGQQTEEGSAPVGPAPGMSEIESAVARLGQPLGHITHEVGPNLSRLQVAGLHPGDRFDEVANPSSIQRCLSGTPEPRHVHIAGHEPVGVEARCARRASDRDRDRSPSRTPNVFPESIPFPRPRESARKREERENAHRIS